MENFLRFLFVVLFVTNSYAYTSSEYFSDKLFDAVGKMDLAYGSLKKAENKKILDYFNETFSQSNINKNIDAEVDLLKKLDVCNRINDISKLFLYDGFKKILDDSDTEQNRTIKIVRLAQENSYKLQDELAFLLPATFHCLSKISNPLSSFFIGLPIDQRTEIRIAGLNQARNGNIQVYFGALTNLADTNFSAEFKELTLSSLEQHLDDFVLPLTVQNRNLIVKETEKVEFPIIYSERIKNLTKRIIQLECTDVCKF